MKFYRTLSILALSTIALNGQQIDLVKHGKETFHALGCAECHSEIKNDNAVKTGPGVYGLFQQTPRKRDLITEGEEHKITVKADLAYLTKSLRQPNAELAIAEIGATKGKPYLPIMPPYDAKVLSDFKVRAIYHYLATLNDKDQQGPSKLLANDETKTTSSGIEQNPYELLVTDRTRIQRVRLDNSSARAIAVGHPSGLNYVFDPRTLSFERVWWGGFLNIGEELKGRGGKNSRLGHKAWEIPFSEPLLRPINHSNQKPVDLSYKSPLHNDVETINKFLYHEKDFEYFEKKADADFLGYKHESTPMFIYRCGPNFLRVKFDAKADGTAEIKIDGVLIQPQKFQVSKDLQNEDIKEILTITKLPASFKFTLPTLPKSKPLWRPNGITNAPSSQPMKASPASKVWLQKNYSAESIAPPTDRHGRPQLFEPLGMDEAKDGSIIVSTRNAGVWRLKNNQWTMIAEGLLDALGVIAEDDGSLIIAQKPELTRLRDNDGDGIYETYETLSDDFLATTNYHEYLHGPAKDAEGNYYIQTNLAHHNNNKIIHKAGGKFMGSQGGYRGWALKVSPEGVTTPFASGLRSPAGLATSPDGKLYYTENQGEYNGTSKLYLLKENSYYGHPSGLVDLPGMNPKSPEIDWKKWNEKQEPAVALLPHSRLANAPGSPSWDTTKGAFGPFEKNMFIGDQTLSRVFRVVAYEKGEAAVIPFAQHFPSGAMRLHFTNAGALYVGQTGRGWRANGGSEAALVRITPDKKIDANPLLNITRKGDDFTLHFQRPIEAEKVNISINSWFYTDAPNYGSPENDATSEKQLSPAAISSDKKSITVYLKPRKLENTQYVYHFKSSDLPHNAYKNFEAFFTRSGK